MARGNYLRSVWCGKSCVFCGGGTPATTADHVPPKVMFLNQDRPRGMEVPSCARCNSGRSQWDQIAANIATMSDPESVFGRVKLSERGKSIMHAMVNNLYPVVADGTHQLHNTHSTLSILDPQTRESMPVEALELKKEISQGLALWCAHQCVAFHYIDTGRVAPQYSTIEIKLLPNVALQQHGIDELVFSMGSEKTLSSGTRSSSKDFSYKTHYLAARKKCIVFAQYKNGFGFLGCVNENRSASISRRTLGLRFKINASRGIHLFRDFV